MVHETQRDRVNPDALHPDTVPVEHAERLRTPAAGTLPLAERAPSTTRTIAATMTLLIGSLVALGMGWLIVFE